MNCQEFRQLYMTEPRCRETAFLEHKQDCRACTEFTVQETAFEHALSGALAVPVPAELPARVVLNQTVRNTRRPFSVAVAAAVLITVAVTATLLRPWSSSLEQDVIAHIVDEREHLAARATVPDKKVMAVFDTLGVRARPPLSNVRYAGVCPIRRQPGGHLILAGTQGPVTLLFMPHEPIGRLRPIEAEGFHGIIVPHGTGSVAIVGQPGEALDEFKRQLAAVPDIS